MFFLLFNDKYYGAKYYIHAYIQTQKFMNSMYVLLLMQSGKLWVIYRIVQSCQIVI